MTTIGFIIAATIAALGVAVAVRFLYLAWKDAYLGPDRRRGEDRRKSDLSVPMERRRRQRRT